MSKPDPTLVEHRAARNRARDEFNRQLAQARADLAPTMLKRRVLAEAQRTTLSVAQQAIEIANDSRGVVAATVAALALWLTRKPIMAEAGKLLHRYRTRNAKPELLGDRVKLVVADYWQRLKEYAHE